MPCEGDAPVVLGDDGWASTGPPPFQAPCCDGEWIAAGDALVVILAAGASDGSGPLRGPDVRAAVWVPPDG